MVPIPAAPAGPSHSADMAMALPSQVILYVSDPAKSAAFYEAILEIPAKILSPNFAVLDLGKGFQLGLLARAKVSPEAPIGVSSELCFIEADRQALESLHRTWVSKGVTILLQPQLMYFGGHNFLGADPDGNRLRVSTPDR
jgi:hypothetical protein